MNRAIARDATVRGYHECNVLCSNTDILVLLPAQRQDLCQEIWMFSCTSQAEESFLADTEVFVCQLYNHGTGRVDIDEDRAAAFRMVKNCEEP